VTVTRQNPRPRVYAWVSRSVQNSAWGTTDAYRHEQIDLSDDVIGIECSRDINGPMGSARLTVMPRTSIDKAQTGADIDRIAVLYQRLDHMSVVSIGMDEDGGIGLYLVRARRRRKQRAGPMAGSFLTIEMVDFGYVLSADHIVFASLTVQTGQKFVRQIEATLGKDSPLIAALPGIWGPINAPVSADTGVGTGDGGGGTVLGESSADVGTTFTVDNAQGVPTFIGQPVDAVLLWILYNATSMRVPLLAKADGSGGAAGDFISMSTSVVTWNEARIWSDAPKTFQGSLWDFLWTVLDRDFYEMRLDYKPQATGAIPRMHLVVRPKPLDEPGMEFLPVEEDPGLTWDALTTFIDEIENHDIPEHEVLDEDLGVTAGDAFGYYIVTGTHDLIGNDQAAKEGIAYPVVDAWIAKKFGLQQYNTRLSLLASDFTEKIEAFRDTGAVNPDTDAWDGEVFSEVAEFRNRLVNWYRLAPWMETGTITVVGRDRYRPGDPVRLEWQTAPVGNEMGMRYYCTGVSWSWQFGGAYTCKLQLSRGHNQGMVDALRAEIDAASPADVPGSLIVASEESTPPVQRVSLDDPDDPETVITATGGPP
jgi:hypothetical protein